MNCLVCRCECKSLFEFRVRGQFDAELFECKKCRFTFVSNPSWLESSFNRELNELDLGTIDRCLIFADFTEALITSIGKASGRFLDWGGGYGILTRIMRDRGLDFENYDPFVNALFVGPAVGDNDKKYDLITMSEVALHITNPVEVLAKILRNCDYLLISAVIAPSSIPQDWWYLMPDTGQHVAIYHPESIRELARQLRVNVMSDGKFFHLFYKKDISMSTRLMLRFRPVGFLCAWLLTTKRYINRGLGRNHSLTNSDQQKLISQLPWNR